MGVNLEIVRTENGTVVPLERSDIIQTVYRLGSVQEMHEFDTGICFELKARDDSLVALELSDIGLWSEGSRTGAGYELLIEIARATSAGVRDESGQTRTSATEFYMHPDDAKS